MSRARIYKSMGAFFAIFFLLAFQNCGGFKALTPDLARDLASSPGTGGTNGSSLRVRAATALDPDQPVTPAKLTGTWQSLKLPPLYSDYVLGQAVWTGQYIAFPQPTFQYFKQNGAAFDTVTGRWSMINLDNSVTCSNRQTTALVDTKLVVICGTGNGTPTGPAGAVYDTVTGTWSPMSTVGRSTADTVPMAIAGRGNVFVVSNIGRHYSVYDLASNTWRYASDTQAPLVGMAGAGVWTGAQFIVWGGKVDNGNNGGGIYDPASDTWRPMTKLNQPDILIVTASAWTGSKFLVWGKQNGVTKGATYDPVADKWAPIAAPQIAPRDSAITAWTGTKLLVWSGMDFYTGTFADGAAYDVASNTWSAISTVNAPSARPNAQSAWSGTELYVWGGDTPQGVAHDGAIYNPQTDTWRPLPAFPGFTARASGNGAFVGGKFLIWGGAGGADGGLGGLLYDIDNHAWLPITGDGAPPFRQQMIFTRVGQRLFAWGGLASTGNTTSRSYNDGYLYDPYQDAWASVAQANAPSPRVNAEYQWTGSKLAIWGGVTGGTDSAGNALATPLADGRVYDPLTNTWAPFTPPARPRRYGVTPVTWQDGTGRPEGSNVIAYWGGNDANENAVTSPAWKMDGVAASVTGGVAFAIPADPALSARAYGFISTAANRLLIWGGYSAVNGFAQPNSDGAYFDFTTAAWTPIPISALPKGAQPVAWDGEHLIAFGGAANSDAIFDAKTGQTKLINTANAPADRRGTQLWTGAQLLHVGRGPDFLSFTGLAWIYDASSDQWTQTPNVPVPKTAGNDGWWSFLWTGRELFVLNRFTGGPWSGPGAVMN